MKSSFYTLIFLCYSLLNIYTLKPTSTQKSVAVTATKTQKVPLLIVELKDPAKSLADCCSTIKRNLSFTGQFKASIQILAKVNNTEIPLIFLKEWAAEYPFITSISHDKNYCVIKFYDTAAHKVTTFKNLIDNNLQSIGHEITNEILKLLTSKSGPFGSKIVFCKENKKGKTDICIADYDGQNVQVVTSRPSLAIAPRFNNDQSNPVILFSEYGAINCSLKMTTLKGKVELATNFDGINMQPAFSPDGKDAILCISAKGNSRIYRSQFNTQKKRQEYTCLTNNDGTNISPVFTSEGKIVFCSDFKTGLPQIYIMDKNGKNITCLTDGGMCTCPSYNPINNKIAFIKIIEGKGQIMSYDCTKKTTEQLTYDGPHKDEVSWSPCGNYLLFAAEENNKNYVAVFNNATKEQKYLTDGTYNISYPYWSPYTLLS